MCSLCRTSGGLTRDIVLVCLADAVVGVAFGAIAVSSGLPLWLPVLLSVMVFAGAAQFLFVGLIAAGGNPVAVVTACLLVNSRLIPLGFAVGDVLGPGWLRRLVGSHLVVDETAAFAIVQPDADRRRRAFWTCGVALFVSWNAGVLAGAFGGAALTDTSTFGLDAAFPAVLLALAAPSMTDASTRRAALVGAAIAVAAVPFLPAGLPVLLALAGVLTTLHRDDPTSGARPPTP